MAFVRKRAIWQLRGEPVTLGVRTLITARIELRRGGRESKPDPVAMLDLARDLESAGADIVELNPGRPALASGLPSPATEIPALVPTLRRIAPRLGVPLSVLTPNADTARRAVDLGAAIIHDVTGLAYDKSIAAVANDSAAALVLGHMRGSPDQWGRLAPLARLGDHIRTDFRASLLRAHKAGIDRRRIVLDPGLEHGKRGHENFELLRFLGSLVPPGQGVQATLAGKRFLVDSVRASPAQRRAALSVAATLALESGAHLLTVGRPESIREATGVVDRIYAGDEAAGAAR